jgi:hypothetical protein
MSLQYVTFQYIALNESQNMIIQSKAQGEKTTGKKKTPKRLYLTEQEDGSAQHTCLCFHECSVSNF